MVSSRLRESRLEVGLQPRLALCGLRNGIASRSVARRTARVLGWVVGPGDQGIPPSEQELFVTLLACAVRAGRFGNLMDVFGAKRRLWHERWRTIRDHLVVENLGLVYAAARRFPCWTLNREEQQSAGKLALLRAVDSFNPWLGFRFSTYAYHAIRRSIIAESIGEQRWRTRYVEVCRDRAEPARRAQAAQHPEDSSDAWVDRLRMTLAQNRADLDARTSLVLSHRFPMDGTDSATLGNVGKALGLSKERVRQIQKTGLAKLRQTLEADPQMQ